MSAILSALCLDLTENKMGIRYMWWFQHETVTQFNAKYKTEKKGEYICQREPSPWALAWPQAVWQRATKMAWSEHINQMDALLQGWKKIWPPWKLFFKLLLTVPFKLESDFLFTLYFFKSLTFLIIENFDIQHYPFSLNQFPQSRAALSNTVAASHI